MRRLAALVTTLLLAACSGGTSTLAPATPAPTTPALASQATPSTPTPAPGAMGTCSVEGTVSGGLALTLPRTIPAQLGWTGDPEAWGISGETPTAIDVPLADGSTLPMTLRLGFEDEDGSGPGAPNMNIILVGPTVAWPSPAPGGTPLPRTWKGPSVFINLYWTSSPQPTQSFPPGEGSVVFKGRFSVSFDVTFPSRVVQTVSMPSSSVLGPGDISARGSVVCE
jgi:hypothetical protein